MEHVRRLAEMAFIVVACATLQGCLLAPAPSMLECNHTPDGPATFYNIHLGEEQELGNPCASDGGQFFPEESFTLDPLPDGFTLLTSTPPPPGFPSYRLRVDTPAVPGQTYVLPYTFTTFDGRVGTGNLDAFVSQRRGVFDLDTTVSAFPDPVTVGATLTYTITVLNLGDDATGVTVVDPLPAQVTFLSATPSQGSCLGTGPVTCNLGALARDGVATVSLAVTAVEPGSVTNTVSVQSDEIGPTTAAATTTALNPGLDITLTSSPEPVPLLHALTLSIAVANHGPSSDSNVVVTYTATIPLNLLAIEVITPSQGACSPPVGTRPVICQLGSLAAGATATITMTAFPDLSGAFMSTATASSTEAPPSTAVVITTVQ